MILNLALCLWLISFVRKTTRAGAPSPLLLCKRNGRQISSYLPAGTSVRFKPSRMTTPCDSSARCVSCLLRIKLLDREIIDADEFYSSLGQRLRCFQIEVSKVSVKFEFGFTPERGVASFEKYSLRVRRAVGQHKLFVDGAIVFRHCNHFRFANQHVQSLTIRFSQRLR